jgi:hypothetical protein
MKKILFISAIVLAFLTSCENQDWEFPDFEYQSVYFAYQTPMRTITLGEDIFDTSLDNEYKCMIMATTGGVYNNPSNITINFAVDNSLCTDRNFGEKGGDLVAMPDNYYSLAANNIVIAKGSRTGGVQVQLTDAFFADPLAITNTYVIPLRMTSVQNADTILSGKTDKSDARLSIAGDWDVQPKNYILYAVKYINKYHGFYLRRGKDVVTGKNGNTDLNETIVREDEYVEKDEVVSLVTRSLSDVEYSFNLKDNAGTQHVRRVLLSFNSEGKCTVTSAQEGFTASGTGEFKIKGEKNSWGGKDRDAIYLNFVLEFDDFSVAIEDTIVLRDRGVKLETF